MSIKKHITYVQAVDMYVGANTEWLSDDEQPLITALYRAAEQLDKRTAASLLGEFRQVMREIHKRKPGAALAEKLDEFDELMKDFT